MKNNPHIILLVLSTIIISACTTVRPDLKKVTKLSPKTSQVVAEPKIFWFDGYGSQTVISRYSPGESEIICKGAPAIHVSTWTTEKVGTDTRHRPKLEHAKSISSTNVCFVVPTQFHQSMQIQHFTETQNNEGACSETIKTRIAMEFHQKVMRCALIAKATSIDLVNVVFYPDEDGTSERYFLTLDKNSIGKMNYHHYTQAEADDRVADEAELKVEIENDSLRNDGNAQVALINIMNRIEYLITTDSGIECSNIRLRKLQKNVWVEVASDSMCAR